MRHAERPESYMQPDGLGPFANALMADIIIGWSCLLILLSCFWADRRISIE